MRDPIGGGLGLGQDGAGRGDEECGECSHGRDRFRPKVERNRALPVPRLLVSVTR